MGHKGELGIVEPNALADLLLVDGNPRADLSILVGPDRFVMFLA
jgi:imidazolonepropionase-like amidohydrolase